MVVTRWTEKETCRFVELYKEQECLWNTGIGEYRNNRLRQEAYEELQRQMNIEGFNVNEVKQKIKNLRNTYNQEITKIEKSISAGMEGTAIYSPAVKWFQTMDQIVTKIKENKPHALYFRSQKPYLNADPTIVKQDPDALDDVHLYTVEEDKFSEQQPIIHEQPSVFCQSFINTGLDDRGPSPSPIPNTGAVPDSSRRKRRAVISAAVEKLREVHQSLEEFLEDEDDFDAFGHFVALSLKKLPLQQALEAQAEMQNTLTKFRLMHLDSSASCGTSQRQHGDFRPSTTSVHTNDQPPQPPIQFYITENSA